jgi:hypothetical protein
LWDPIKATVCTESSIIYLFSSHYFIISLLKYCH